MLYKCDESEKAAMLRDARIKAELEENTKLNVAKREGLEEGLTEGLEKGIKQATSSNIKAMYSHGLDEASIAEILSLDIEYVKEVLEK